MTPVRGIGVTDEASGAGVADYRLRERTVDGGTYAEQYLLPVRERVPSFRGMCGDWWAGNAGATTSKTTLCNIAGSPVLVAVRSCVIHMVPWDTASASIVEARLYMQNATPTNGNVLTKVSAGTGPDAAQTSDTSVVLRSRHASDNSAATGITLSLGSPILYRAARPHTTTTTGGQYVSARGVYPAADFNQDAGDNMAEELIIGGAIVLRAGWSLAVTTFNVGATVNVTQVAVSWLWDEYTLP